MASKLFTLSKNKIARDSQLELTSDCLDYILETELEDFIENPSKEHVYYKAYSACFGPFKANKMLAESIKDSGIE